MLKEFENVRQEQHTTRRLFLDDYFDLYIWYKKNTDHKIGFQLIYSVNRKQMALTYDIGEKPKVQIVDNADQFYNPSPILDGRGIFLKDQILKEFSDRSIELEDSIIDFVLDTLKRF